MFTTISRAASDRLENYGGRGEGGEIKGYVTSTKCRCVKLINIGVGTTEFKFN